MVTAEALEQLRQNSLELSPSITQENRISIYGKGEVSSKVLADCIIRIKKAFPRLQKGWYETLQEFLVLEGFTEQRLIDATANLIRTCQYPEPTIANILNYDRTKLCYTYEQLLAVTNNFSPESRKKYFQKFQFIEGKYVEQ